MLDNDIVLLGLKESMGDSEREDIESVLGVFTYIRINSQFELVSRFLQKIIFGRRVYIYQSRFAGKIIFLVQFILRYRGVYYLRNLMDNVLLSRRGFRCGYYFYKTEQCEVRIKEIAGAIAIKQNNNLFLSNMRHDFNSILYISQFTKTLLDNDYWSEQGRWTLRNNVMLVSALSSLVDKNQQCKVYVLARPQETNEDAVREVDFFRSMNQKFIIIPYTQDRDSVTVASEFNTIVSVASTLGIDLALAGANVKFYHDQLSPVYDFNRLQLDVRLVSSESEIIHDLTSVMLQS